MVPEPNQPAPEGFRLYKLAEDLLERATYGNCDNLLASTEALQNYATERYGIAISQVDAERRCCSNQGTIPQFGDLIS